MRPIILCFFSLIFNSICAFSQGVKCTIQSTPQQLSSLESKITALKNQKSTALATSIVINGITYLPIKFYDIRKSDGTTERPVSNSPEQTLNNTLGMLNGAYIKANMQFYLCGTNTFTHIDNDQNYNFTFGAPLYPSAVDAINVYYHPFGSYYASYPDISQGSNYVAVGWGGLSGITVLAHELGHYFSLIHTFGDNNTKYDFPTGELVTRGVGANCSTQGDRICDTPADPQGLPNTNLDPFSCIYSGTATDRNGVKFMPMTNNFMAYAFACGNLVFTQGQFDRIGSGLTLRTATNNNYHLDYPPSIVTTPTDCYVLKLSTNKNIPYVFWTDNSNNETGFIVERSSNSSTGFVGVGGVGPNETSFIDYSIPTGATVCYYRIKPSNTTTASYSNVGGFGVGSACASTYLVPNINQSVVIQVFNYIKAFGIISNAANVVFKSENYIELNAGFDTQTGVVFNAQIATCPNARQGITEELPQDEALLVYPNPAEDLVQVRYQLKASEIGHVKLFVSNEQGQTLTTLLDGQANEEGIFTVPFNSQNLPSGLYLCSLQTIEGIKTKRLIIQR